MGAISKSAVLGAYAGKRVFITGHTGFKGSWLTFLMQELGAEVRGYALAPETSPSHFEMLGLSRSIDHVVGDVRDGDALKAALVSFRPEFVFHLAAQALVKKSYADPAATFGTNVMGSVSLLEAVRACPSVCSLVYVTSDKCYENLEWVWGYRESDRLGGYDPYSASKAAAEIVFSAYARSYFSAIDQLGAATARAGNVIGGGDWAADRIVPDCIRAVGEGRPIQIRNPAATRPWQHVLEPIAGYIMLGARLRNDPVRYAGAWNFGPPTDEVRTVHDVAAAIVGVLGRGSIEVVGAEGMPHEARLLQLNCDKAHQDLGWRPRWDVDATLSATGEWYRDWMGGADVSKITRRQLRDFFTELS
jgi:CDP-glucose 4,6-dehydratase